MLSGEFVARAAVLSALAGLAALHFFSATEPEGADVSGLVVKGEGSLVSLKGKVESVRQLNGNIFFELNDGNRAKAVLFNADNAQRNALRKNSFVEVVGRIEDYKGSRQIVVLSVKQVD